MIAASVQLMIQAFLFFLQLVASGHAAAGSGSGGASVGASLHLGFDGFLASMSALFRFGFGLG